MNVMSHQEVIAMEPMPINHVLAELKGKIVRGTERISTKDALAFLGMAEHEYKLR
jgi:hypothetical protein